MNYMVDKLKPNIGDVVFLDLPEAVREPLWGLIIAPEKVQKLTKDMFASQITNARNSSDAYATYILNDLNGELSDQIRFYEDNMPCISPFKKVFSPEELSGVIKGMEAIGETYMSEFTFNNFRDVIEAVQVIDTYYKGPRAAKRLVDKDFEEITSIHNLYKVLDA